LTEKQGSRRDLVAFSVRYPVSAVSMRKPCERKSSWQGEKKYIPQKRFSITWKDSMRQVNKEISQALREFRHHENRAGHWHPPPCKYLSRTVKADPSGSGYPGRLSTGVLKSGIFGSAGEKPQAGLTADRPDKFLKSVTMKRLRRLLPAAVDDRQQPPRSKSRHSDSMEGFQTFQTFPTSSGPGFRVSFPGRQPEGVASVPLLFLTCWKA